MANWRRKCPEFKEVREQIYVADCYGVMNSLLKICKKFALLEDIYALDFEMLADDISESLDGYLEETKETTDYYLNEFYDLCNSAGIWLEFKEGGAYDFTGGQDILRQGTVSGNSR